MNFNELIEENYKGFAQGSDLDTFDLKLMYYGRHNIYVHFTDDGELSNEVTYYEIDRPKSMVCYPVNDVVGKRVKSSQFYMNIIRKGDNGHLRDIKQYSKDDLERDVEMLRRVGLDSELLEFYINEIAKNTLIKSPFERLWLLTESLSLLDKAPSWGELFLILGYNQISDPTGSGILVLGRTPVSLILDSSGVEEIDILRAQKGRIDPRRRTNNKVLHKLKSLKSARRRVAKRTPTKNIRKI